MFFRSCGHWGLLSVHPEAQGTGVASVPWLECRESMQQPSGFSFWPLGYFDVQLELMLESHRAKPKEGKQIFNVFEFFKGNFCANSSHSDEVLFDS